MASAELLKIDCQREVERISAGIIDALQNRLKRKGLIVAISGGIDSSVSLALGVKAIGSERVFALQLPEKQSSMDTLRLSSAVADHYHIARELLDITPILTAVGYYDKYIRAARLIVPEYDEHWESKIAISSAFKSRGFSTFSIVARSPSGETLERRLNAQAYLEIVACTNFKQRIRKMMEYYFADRMNYAVVGTPNRLEYDQGFFVKLGDGAADLKPIAHLYKTQVYDLARYLKVPEEIIGRVPTTDTYSLSQGQDEFYFSLPYDKMDICLYGKNNGLGPITVGEMIGLSEGQVKMVYQDIDKKRATTRYLHMAPILMERVAEIVP